MVSQSWQWNRIERSICATSKSSIGLTFRSAAFLILFAFLTHPSPAASQSSAQNPQPIIIVPQAAVLGLVEGLTEYLPVSSTGHLVLAAELLGLTQRRGLTEDQLRAVSAYEIVIQSGAILAVILCYRNRFRDMLLGLSGRSLDGRRLFINVCLAVIPIGFAGMLLHKAITAHLHTATPVIAALLIGGVVMLLFTRKSLPGSSNESSLSLITPKTALVIGLFQCLALWPGVSRSMVTILGGMLLSLSPLVAAEFSFLVGLPTLLAATAMKAVNDGPVLAQHIGTSAILVGIMAAAVSAWLAVRTFIKLLGRYGLAPFGIYRIVLAGIMLLIL